jgi:heme oxygenase
MIDIREATKEQHRRAEQQEFVKILISGEIHPKLYATFLYNQSHCYGALEKWAGYQGLLDHLPGIARAEKLANDCQDLWVRITPQPEVTDSTKRYIEHIDNIRREPAKLFAHVYVRYLGDLYGGQMIKTKTPGANTCLEFDNAKELIQAIKETINNYMSTDTNDVIEEAKICFEYATELFKEMQNLNQFQISRNIV